MSTREQWVFLNPCGCAFGVQEANGNPSKAKAWREFFETVEASNAATDRGVTVVLVDHERYVAEYSPQRYSSWVCPHGS